VRQLIWNGGSNVIRVESSIEKYYIAVFMGRRCFACWLLLNIMLESEVFLFFAFNFCSSNLCVNKYDSVKANDFVVECIC
jgi:hypothetical protein